MGTPKTLIQAIDNALDGRTEPGLKQRLYWHIKDFMAQKFGTAYLETSNEDLTKLESLFKSLTASEPIE